MEAMLYYAQFNYRVLTDKICQIINQNKPKMLTGYRIFAILLPGILNTIHFTSMVMRYCILDLTNYQGYWILKKINYEDIASL